MEGGTVTAMSLITGYGRFAAAFNSLLLVLLLGFTPANAQTAPVKLVGLVDSLAAGLGVKPEQSFPARLEAPLKAQGRNAAIAHPGVPAATPAPRAHRVVLLLSA